MRRASDIPLRKVTLNLYSADMDALQRFYGNGRVSEVIQKLVHRHVTSYVDKLNSMEDYDE